ncbi:MAG: hypothetical protein NW701_17395 [Nitrospira sp.]
MDRLHDKKAKQLFADTVKTLSDHSVPASLVMVGVADTVEELFQQHQSIERALVQVRIPRMSRDELHEVVKRGLEKVGMEIEHNALMRISLLSQGLPHYTHLFGLYSAREAIDRGRKLIMLEDISSAISKALEKAQQTIKSAYHRAISSPRQANLYPSVLLACALSRTDDLGYFAAVDVRDPMEQIMKKPYDIPNFARHLNDFCEESRGPLLQKTGSAHRFRFRFINPLMQPYVIMHGVTDGKVPLPLLDESA